MAESVALSVLHDRTRRSICWSLHEMVNGLFDRRLVAPLALSTRKSFGKPRSRTGFFYYFFGLNICSL